MANQRIYVDTSVIGGCFDAQFLPSSRMLLDHARAGDLILLVSDMVLAELEHAPEEVRGTLQSLPSAYVEYWPITHEMEALHRAYLAAGVVGPRSWGDAIHVAGATVARADAIVSWNFKHIVRLDRIKGYNRVNWERGYGVLTIVSPPALAGHGTEE